VTSFFRDREPWAALAKALRELLADKPVDYVFRAWVPACATGEEAYTLAIVLRECMEQLGRSSTAQIFGSDLDPEAIATARAATYGAGIVNDVTPERLARYFTRIDDGYQVRKEIRELVVFAPHSVISDPPFTKLDLLSCRNLLIYLDTDLQRRLTPLFHPRDPPGRPVVPRHVGDRRRSAGAVRRRRSAVEDLSAPQRRSADVRQ